MRRTQPLNPYIALSDIGLSGLLVALCLAGLVNWQLKRAYEKLNNAQQESIRLQKVIRKRQETISQYLETESSRHGRQVACSKGERALLIRLSQGRMFDGDELSPTGLDYVQGVGRDLAAIWPSVRGDREQGYLYGAPIEIQVRSHCQRLTQEMEAWQTTMRRSLAVLYALELCAPGFPSELVTLTGASWRHPAYECTDSVLGTWYRDLKARPWYESPSTNDQARVKKAHENGVTFKDFQPRQKTDDQESLNPEMQALLEACMRVASSDGVEKPKYEERVDVVIVFSGNKNDDAFVPAVNDQQQPQGPVTDTSSSHYYARPDVPTEPPAR